MCDYDMMDNNFDLQCEVDRLEEKLDVIKEECLEAINSYDESNYYYMCREDYYKSLGMFYLARKIIGEINE